MTLTIRVIVIFRLTVTMTKNVSVMFVMSVGDIVAFLIKVIMILIMIATMMKLLSRHFRH